MYALLIFVVVSIRHDLTSIITLKPLSCLNKGFCIVLYCIVVYCIVLYCSLLYCIVLYCIVLYCTLIFGYLDVFDWVSMRL